jgi:hypothetical protein
MQFAHAKLRDIFSMILLSVHQDCGEQGMILWIGGGSLNQA